MANYNNNNKNYHSHNEGGGKNKGGNINIEAIANANAKKIMPLLQLYIDDKLTAEQTANCISAIEEIVEKNKGVKAHQIRNVYALTKAENNKAGLNLIRPKLAYIGARLDKPDGKIIVKTIDNLITNLEDEQIKGFHFIMESIVAYHKFYDNQK